MSPNTLTDLPGQLGQLVFCAAIAAALGWIAYRLLIAGPSWDRSPLTLGAGVIAAGGAVTALVFALIALWAAFLGLAVVSVIAWALTR